MYGWLWRHFYGGRWWKSLQALVLITGVVLVLFLWAFPWVEAQLPYSDVTVPGPSSGP